MTGNETVTGTHCYHRVFFRLAFVLHESPRSPSTVYRVGLQYFFHYDECTVVCSLRYISTFNTQLSQRKHSYHYVNKNIEESESCRQELQEKTNRESSLIQRNCSWWLIVISNLPLRTTLAKQPYLSTPSTRFGAVTAVITTSRKRQNHSLTHQYHSRRRSRVEI